MTEAIFDSINPDHIQSTENDWGCNIFDYKSAWLVRRDLRLNTNDLDNNEDGANNSNKNNNYY